MWNPPSIAHNPLHGLTLLRPWEMAFIAPDAELGTVGRKNIENRSWPPPPKFIGTRIALHAGKGWDESGETFMRTLGVSAAALAASKPSHIVAVVKINAKWKKGEMKLDHDFPYDSPWLFGPVAWWISDVQVLSTPVPCSGHQGLWRIPDAEAKLVKAQVSGVP